MKKFVAVILTFVLAATLFTACDSSKKKATTTAEKKSETIDISDAKLLNDGKLTVGAEMGYPPFEQLKEDGVTPEGFDIDLITAVAEKLGLEVEFVSTSFTGILERIGQDYDVVCSGVTINPERKETNLFSTPYIENYQAVVVRKGSDLKIESFNDLDGKSVALQKGTTSDELMSDYKSTKTIDVEVVANEKVANCFTQLSNEEVDAVVVDSSVADGYLAKNGDKYELAYLDNSEPQEFGIAIGKDNAALQKAINKALKELEEEGQIKELTNFWFTK